MNYKKSSKGFTLVELIVVLVILAILAALLVPALTGYIDRAREKAYIAECRSLVQASQTLASEDYAEGKLDTSTFLNTRKTDIFDLADLAQSGDRDITEISFAQKGNGGVIDELRYRPVAGIEVVYERNNGTPRYTVTTSTTAPGAPTFLEKWADTLNQMNNPTTGNMKNELWDKNNLTQWPPLEPAETSMLQNVDGIIGTNSNTLNKLVWHPVQANSAENGYLLIASEGDGNINANMIYYKGHYYACLNYRYAGSNEVKFDNYAISGTNFQTALLENAKTLASYESDPALLKQDLDAAKDSSNNAKIFVQLK